MPVEWRVTVLRHLECRGREEVPCCGIWVPVEGGGARAAAFGVPMEVRVLSGVAAQRKVFTR